MKKAILGTLGFYLALGAFSAHAQSQPTMTIQVQPTPVTPVLVTSNQAAVVDDKGGLRKCQAINISAADKAKCDKVLAKKPEDNSVSSSTTTMGTTNTMVDQRRGRGTDDVASTSNIGVAATAINGVDQRRGRGTDDKAVSAFK